MGIKQITEKAVSFIKKYRFVFLVLVIGLVLMWIPSPSGRDNSAKSTVVESEKNESSLEERLESILSQISGAGKVNVLLSISSGEETIFQTDYDENTSTDSTQTKADTVTVTDAERNQTGLVRQIIPPNYSGAIIVCQGADNPSVRLSIVDAVSKLTGLGANRISVLKMK